MGCDTDGSLGPKVVQVCWVPEIVMMPLEEKKRGEKQRASWETAEHSSHQEMSGGLWLEDLTRLLF